MTLKLVMGEDPSLSVDFTVREYVSKTFKTGSEFLNRLMETMDSARQHRPRALPCVR